MKKKKAKSKKQKIAIVGFFLFYFYFLLFSFASAWVPGEPLVPCTNRVNTCDVDTCTTSGEVCTVDSDCTPSTPCTQCELLHLVDNLTDFIMIALAPIIATFFFVVAGVYIMLGGSNPGMLSTGKTMFTNTLTGLIIVMLAWLITNTLIQTLADTSRVGSGGNWFSISCTDIGLSTDPPGGGDGGGACGASLTSGPGVRINNFNITPATISDSSRSVNVNFNVTANRSLVTAHCGATDNDFRWAVYERTGGSTYNLVRDCEGDSRGCPEVTSDYQCFNLDFNINLNDRGEAGQVARTFYAFIECNDLPPRRNITQSADIRIQDNN